MRHPNVLLLFGVFVSVDKIHYMVTELMTYGDLKHFLVQEADLDIKTLLEL